MSSRALPRRAPIQPASLGGAWWLGVALGAGVVAGCGPSGGRDAGPIGTSDSGPIDLCSGRYALARRRPEIELLIDRSCAMTERFDGSPGSGPSDGETRWGALRAALESLPPLGLTGVGLVISPDGPECSIPEPRIAPGSGTIMEAVSALSAIEGDLFDGCAVSPVAFGLAPGLETLIASDTLGTSGDPFTVVVMGGPPGCGETVDAIPSLASDVGTDFAVLTLGVDASASALADALGEEHPAAAPGDVAGLLEGILRARASCILDIVEGTPDPDMLQVWVDGASVPADPDEGFSYSPGDNAVILNGSWCDRLVAGDVRQVTAAMGCDESRCVARPERCDGLDEDCDGTVDNDCS